MARAPSTKKRRCAWTLTITATLLAVVWVGGIWIIVGLPICQSVKLYTGRGHIGWAYIDDVQRGGHSSLIEFYDVDGIPLKWWFEHGTFDLGDGTTYSNWFAPLWPFVLLTGVPGVWMLIKTRKHTNPNTCPACGYDRTGLPQSPTGPAPCPECGKRKDDDAMRGRRGDGVTR